jgi:hypothetical protein
MSFTTARRSNHGFARQPNCRSSAPTMPAVTTDVPERELDELWDDGEFILSRVRRHARRPSALVVRPAAVHPADATIARLEHAHSLRGDLDQSWAARPAELIGPRERFALRLEDPGGAGKPA